MKNDHRDEHNQLLQQAMQLVKGETDARVAGDAQIKKFIEKLAATMGLEWSQDVGDWVLGTKLAELRKNPREKKNGA